MEFQAKDEKGKEMFLKLYYWRWVPFGGIFIGTIITIWHAYNRTIHAEGSDGLFDRLMPIVLVIAAIVTLVAAISTALCLYYYIKTAAYLGIKFGLQKSPWGIYREMEQIAKEKKWIK